MDVDVDLVCSRIDCDMDWREMVPSSAIIAMLHGRALGRASTGSQCSRLMQPVPLCRGFHLLSSLVGIRERQNPSLCGLECRFPGKGSLSSYPRVENAEICYGEIPVILASPAHVLGYWIARNRVRERLSKFFVVIGPSSCSGIHMELFIIRK